MSRSTKSTDMVGSRKRSYADVGGPFGHFANVLGLSGSKIDLSDSSFLATTSNGHAAEKEISCTTAPLIPRSLSISCEESSSFLSNDSAETDSDTASESPSVLTFGSTCQQSTKIVSRKRSRCDRDDDDSSSLRMGRAMADREEPPQSNVWDDSSWVLPSSTYLLGKASEGNDSVETMPPTSTSTIQSDTSCSKHGKVQGLQFAATEPLHFETIVWEDIHWKSLTPSPLKTRRISLSDEDGSHTTPSTSIASGKINDEDDVQRNESGCRKQNIVSPETGFAKKSIRERINSYLDAEKQDHPLRTSRLPNLDTGGRNLRVNQSLGGHRSSLFDSPSVLYRWLRVRLEAGLVRSSFNFLHRLLKKYYDDVSQVVQNFEKDNTGLDDLASLESLRERLAGIWCVYAHISLEVGYLVLAGEGEKRNTYRKSIPQVQSGFSFDDFSNHAISILLRARECPLVGNHAAIAVSLGRLIVSSTFLKNTIADCVRVELPRESLLKNIQSAIDACWDCVDLCRLHGHTFWRYTAKPVSKTVIMSLANFELESDNEVGRISALGKFESTLLLPLTLRQSWPSPIFRSKGMKIDYRHTICCLCKELNQWSRLKEKLEVNAQDIVRLSPSFDSELSFPAEELPLYASIDSLSDPLNHYKGAANPGKEIVWQW